MKDYHCSKGYSCIDYECVYSGFAPTVDALELSPQKGPPGTEVTIELTVSDPDGYEDVQSVWVCVDLIDHTPLYGPPDLVCEPTTTYFGEKTTIWICTYKIQNDVCSASIDTLFCGMASDGQHQNYKDCFDCEPYIKFERECD